jgi:hypothetical protein
MILHADGRTMPVRLADDAGPVGEGEVVVRLDYRPDPFIAVDPDTGAAHRITTPPETTELQQAPDGRLLGVVHDHPGGEAEAVWSDDGGSTWQRHVLPMSAGSLLTLVEGGGEGAMTVLAGGDGATLFPFGTMYRSRDGGSTWEAIDVRSDPQAYVGRVAVLPDGRLLVEVVAWSDQGINRAGSRPEGLHLSDGDDWSALLPVETGEPFDRGDDAALGDPNLVGAEQTLEVVATVETRNGLEVFALDLSDPHPHEVFVSEDAGETWVSTSVR